MSIKYYHLAKDETPPKEFCAIRDIGGEPSEYTFYAPEAENAKLRQQLADVTESMGRVEERCAKLRELAEDMWEYVKEYADLLDAEVYGYTWPHNARGYGDKVRNGLGEFAGFPDRMRELGVEVNA